MYNISLNNRSPLYRQIYYYFAKQIEHGQIKIGEKMPSSRDLARTLGVSLNTVLSAYDQLLAEGYLVSKERQGYFVDKLNLDLLDFQGRDQAEIHLLYPTRPRPADYNFLPSQIDRQALAKTSLDQAVSQAHQQLLADDFYLSPDEARQGWAPLRNELVKYLFRRRGLAVSAQDIIISQSYLDSLTQVLQTVNLKGLAHENPGYQELYQLTIKPDKIYPIPLDKYGFSVADLEKTPANLALVTPNHQFPSGIIMVLRRRHRLLAWAMEADNRYIMEDDYDGDFRYQGHPIPALKTLDKEGRVIFSSSFSKNLGPFANLSYFILPESLHQRWLNQAYHRPTPNLLQQMALANYMEAGDFESHLKRMTVRYDKKQRVLMEILSDYPGVEIKSADAGLFLVVEIDPTRWQADLPSKALESEGIAIRKLQDFLKGPVGPDQATTWLFGFGHEPVERLAEGIDRFFAYLSRP